jgi:hypothetical protein
MYVSKKAQKPNVRFLIIFIMAHFQLEVFLGAN